MYFVLLPAGGIVDDPVAAIAVAGTVAAAVSDVCSFSPCPGPDPTYKLPNDKDTLSRPPSPVEEDVAVVVVVVVVSLLLPVVLLLFSRVVVDSDPVVEPRAGEFVFGNLSS